MQNDELPLTEVVDSDQFARAFEKHGVDFGDEEGVVYTPAITLWALVSQTFFAGAQRSCKAAVLRVASLWATRGRTVCDTNTGAYCRTQKGDIGTQKGNAKRERKKGTLYFSCVASVVIEHAKRGHCTLTVLRALLS